ncbi:AcrR family transcriptional regulator [Friedmanniella endophytica]|uniref:AcrR family transcriptional regulator n=1 Tax=Microlunatus kandeliicorticis TaxID=1759536 RepID=A0A7W3INW1_9ACTN|nr:AcrR family transcriptional regulator [Microlunatus kandeliicorticis]
MFRSQGYLGTTLADVASSAGVSVQTVYNLVGGKPALLKAVYDRSVAGDDAEVPMAQRPIIQAMTSAPDARTALGLYAQLARQIGERTAAIISVILAQAAAGDPLLTELADTVERERGFGTTATAHHLAATFGLRPELDETAAADVLWVLTAPEVADRLVRRRGWSWDAYEHWLARTMTDALIGPDRAG